MSSPGGLFDQLIPLASICIYQWDWIEGHLILSGYEGDLLDEPLDRGLNVVLALMTRDRTAKEFWDAVDMAVEESKVKVRPDKETKSWGSAGVNVNTSNPAIQAQLAQMMTEPEPSDSND